MAVLGLLSTLLELKTLVLLSIIILVAIYIRSHFQNRHHLPLPPQPPGYPILGNTLEFIPAAQRGQMHLLLQKWAKENGEIMRVKVGPTTNYYLNSDRAVKALMDKSSAQTSERPRWIVSNELLCNRWNVLLLNASDPRWKVSFLRGRWGTMGGFGTDADG